MISYKKSLELHRDKHTPTSDTSDRSHAMYVSAVSKGDPPPDAKRIGWLKTSDFEGCRRPDGGFRKKERAKSVEPESWERAWTGFNNRTMILTPLSSTVVVRRLLACWVTLYLQVRPLPWSIHSGASRFLCGAAEYSPPCFHLFQFQNGCRGDFLFPVRQWQNNQGERFTFSYGSISLESIIFYWIPPWVQGWDSILKGNRHNILQNDIRNCKTPQLLFHGTNERKGLQERAA